MYTGNSRGLTGTEMHPPPFPHMASLEICVKKIGSKQGYEKFPFLLRDSRASETRFAFLAWGDFHARSRFALSAIPEEKWELLPSSKSTDSTNRPPFSKSPSSKIGER